MRVMGKQLYLFKEYDRISIVAADDLSERSYLNVFI